MADPIKLVECPRDAWQGLPGQIPTAVKVEYLKSLVAAGFKHIDAVSFVSPRAVPQMADSETVISELDPSDDVEIIGIVVNERGAERAISTDAVRTLGFPYSLSPTFLKNNQNQTLEENLDILEKVRTKADENGLDTVAYISMAFGNPYGDLWNADELIEGIGLLADLDLQAISLADTVGLATPQLIGDLLGPVLEKFEGVEIGVHLHSRPDEAAAKVLAAYDVGCRRFDSAIGGMGGCPFAQDVLVGNIPTGKLLEALKGRGVELPFMRSITEPFRMAVDIASRFSGPKM
ncbi:MAG: hydroxymethylglutaryl-CoA lyase [Acidobacteriota bacterium]|nr:hydroxymethylglutaryl-CoA lyase [Acidobacteriota bacterium]